MLGIPTVQDRYIQQMLLQVMTPIFDPEFSEHSYGFRPGRSAQDAVRAAQKYVQGGKEWVVDIDIAKFFDHVNHDILMKRIAAVIRDKRVLQLIGKYLRRGALVEGVVMASGEGTPQGGPLSPLLANIYLDALDRELDRRGHGYCRYADDCNIYVGSQAAAERTLASIQSWIEKHLRLQVNAAKSGTGKAWERKFLGFRLDRKKRIGIAPESLERFKVKVREMWDGRRNRSSNQLRDEWRQYVRGWWEYFQLAETRSPIFQLEGWVRRHIRKCFWLRWHGTAGRLRRLRQLGLRGKALGVATSRRGAWGIAKQPELHRALNNAVLRRHGFLLPSDLAAKWAAAFNRRMRKTARPVAWEGDGAQSPSLDPIQGVCPTILRFYSVLSVVMGSTRAARRAGPAAAINATNTSSPTASASGRGSPGAT